MVTFLFFKKAVVGNRNYPLSTILFLTHKLATPPKIGIYYVDVKGCFCLKLNYNRTMHESEAQIGDKKQYRACYLKFDGKPFSRTNIFNFRSSREYFWLTRTVPDTVIFCCYLLIQADARSTGQD